MVILPLLILGLPAITACRESPAPPSGVTFVTVTANPEQAAQTATVVTAKETAVAGPTKTVEAQETADQAEWNSNVAAVAAPLQENFDKTQEVFNLLYGLVDELSDEFSKAVLIEQTQTATGSTATWQFSQRFVDLKVGIQEGLSTITVDYDYSVTFDDQTGRLTITTDFPHLEQDQTNN